MNLKRVFRIGAAAVVAAALIACGGDSGGGGPNEREQLGQLWAELEHMTVLVVGDAAHPRGLIDNEVALEIDQLRLFSDVWILPAGSEATRTDFTDARETARMYLTDPTVPRTATELTTARLELEAASEAVTGFAGVTNNGTVDRGRLQAAIAAAIPLVGLIPASIPASAAPPATADDRIATFRDGPNWTNSSFMSDVWTHWAFQRGSVAPFQLFEDNMAAVTAINARTPAPTAAPGAPQATPGGTGPDGPWIRAANVVEQRHFIALFDQLGTAIDIRDNKAMNVNALELQASVDGQERAVSGLTTTLRSFIADGQNPFVRIGYVAGMTPNGQPTPQQRVITDTIRVDEHFAGRVPSNDAPQVLTLVASNTRRIWTEFVAPSDAAGIGITAAAGTATTGATGGYNGLVPVGMTSFWRFVDENGVPLVNQPTLMNGGIELRSVGDPQTTANTTSGQLVNNPSATTLSTDAAPAPAQAVDVRVGSARDVYRVRLFHGGRIPQPVGTTGTNELREVPLRADHWASNILVIDTRNVEAPPTSAIVLGVNLNATGTNDTGLVAGNQGAWATPNPNTRNITFTGAAGGTDAVINLRALLPPNLPATAYLEWTVSNNNRIGGVTFTPTGLVTSMSAYVGSGTAANPQYGQEIGTPVTVNPPPASLLDTLAITIAHRLETAAPNAPLHLNNSGVLVVTVNVWSSNVAATRVPLLPAQTFNIGVNASNQASIALGGPITQAADGSGTPATITGTPAGIDPVPTTLNFTIENAGLTGAVVGWLTGSGMSRTLTIPTTGATAGTFDVVATDPVSGVSGRVTVTLTP